jgi:hypothetical protein
MALRSFRVAFGIDVGDDLQAIQVHRDLDLVLGGVAIRCSRDGGLKRL